MKRIESITCFLSAVLFSASVAAQCIEYEPKTVSLSGTLARETHPGRPNFESIEKGDEPQTIWVLRLKEPICVAGSNKIDVKEETEKEVQLVLEPEQYRQYRRFLEQNVSVAGKLFHGHTGHHYKRLLLKTIEIKSNAQHVVPPDCKQRGAGELCVRRNQ